MTPCNPHRDSRQSKVISPREFHPEIREPTFSTLRRSTYVFGAPAKLVIRLFAFLQLANHARRALKSTPKDLAKLHHATRDARFHRSNRHLQYFRNFLIGMVSQVEQRNRRLVDFIYFGKSGQHSGGVHANRKVAREDRQVLKWDFV